MVPAGMEASIIMLLRRGVGNTETRKLFTDAFFRGRFWPPKPTSASASHFGIVSMDGHQIRRPVRMLLSADQTESRRLERHLAFHRAILASMVGNDNRREYRN